MSAPAAQQRVGGSTWVWGLGIRDDLSCLSGISCVVGVRGQKSDIAGPLQQCASPIAHGHTRPTAYACTRRQL